MKNSPTAGQMALIAMGLFMVFIGLDLLFSKRLTGLCGIASGAIFLFLALTAEK